MTFQAKVTDKHEKEIKKKNWVSKKDIELKPNPQPNLIPTSLPIEEDLYNISPHLPYAKVKKVHTPCLILYSFILLIWSRFTSFDKVVITFLL